MRADRLITLAPLLFYLFFSPSVFHLSVFLFACHLFSLIGSNLGAAVTTPRANDPPLRITHSCARSGEKAGDWSVRRCKCAPWCMRHFYLSGEYRISWNIEAYLALCLQPALQMFLLFWPFVWHTWKGTHNRAERLWLLSVWACLQ